jgi:hypothetical protein
LPQEAIVATDVAVVVASAEEAVVVTVAVIAVVVAVVTVVTVATALSAPLLLNDCFHRQT